MLKFSVHTEGMDAIKDKLTEGCTKAEHTGCAPSAQRYIPICSDAYWVPGQTDTGRRGRGDLSRPICPLPLFWEADGRSSHRKQLCAKRHNKGPD